MGQSAEKMAVSRAGQISLFCFRASIYYLLSCQARAASTYNAGLLQEPIIYFQDDPKDTRIPALASCAVAMLSSGRD